MIHLYIGSPLILVLGIAIAVHRGLLDDIEIRRHLSEHSRYSSVFTFEAGVAA